MKASLMRPAVRQTAFAAAVGVNLLMLPKVSAQAIAPAQVTTGATAEVERVIVTGSNIPTAEETGPNPVDTYRPADIEKLGIRNATDLTTFLPQQSGATTNLNIGNGGDGTVQFNLRGLLSKETLVLVDGKRVAFGSLSPVGFSGGVDINLIPFPMIDHIDILKDGASAVYGSDAITGVVNFFLVHKFRGLEIGGSYGNTNLGASNDMGEWEAWIKAGTGDDKTEIVVIADFWERTGGIFSADRDLSSNAFQIPWGGGDLRNTNFPGRVQSGRLRPGMFFGPGGTPLAGVNTPLPHSAPNAATSPFYKIPLFRASAFLRGCRALSIPMRIQARPVSSAQMHSSIFHSSALTIKAAAITSSTTSQLERRRFHRLIARPFTVRSRAMCVTNI